MRRNRLLLSRVFILAAVIAAIWLAPVPDFGVANAQSRPRAQALKRYACPMHPDVTSRKSGKCRKCGMALRLVERSRETVVSGKVPSNAVTEGVGDTGSFSSSRIPDLPVYDQNGKQLNFYRDLIQGKTVAINFIFTTCTTICPPLTATFRRVQQDLTTLAPDAKLISISVDPTTDTPQRLMDFASKFKAGPGWTFVTGDSANITLLLRAFGTAVTDKNDHTPMILIGNDSTGYWTRAYGLSSPSALVKSIAEAANHN